MLEDAFWEEDIWEYKSKRKPKPEHLNDCSENIPESVGIATDGKSQSKRKGHKKRTTKDNGKNREKCLGETDCQISIGSSQNSSCRDGIQQSQSKETTPRKHCKPHKSKQASPKIRPVYDGYCPSCQMPFSSLLGQTPRWHVFECLDSPPVSDTECPDGLLCTSTMPSHYKKYMHLLLAQSRASNEPFSSPPCVSGGGFTPSKPDPSHNLEERWCVHPKQIENLKNVSADSMLMTQCLKTAQPPTETNKKIPTSLSSQTSQQAPQFTKFVNKEKVVGVGLPLDEEESNSQSKSQSMNLPLPRNDSGSCEISYSPLQSDEETYDIDEELDDSQQELFFTQSSKDSSLEDDDSSTMFEKLHDPYLKDAERICPTVNSFITQDNYSRLCDDRILSDSFQLISQATSSVSHGYPTYSDDNLLLFSPAKAELLTASNTTNTKPGEPKGFHSSPSTNLKRGLQESAVYNQICLPLLRPDTSKPFEWEGGEYSPLHPPQNQTRELPSKKVCAKKSANSACICRKASDNMVDGRVTALNVEKCSNIPLAKTPLKTSFSGPKCSASQPSAKVMKQMDIGVYFGLPPKRPEEKTLEESVLEGLNVTPVVSPNEKRSRSRKRKAENSLSDLEFDAKNLNESQHSVELCGKRSWHRRKRHKNSNSPQKGACQKRSDHLIDSPELGAVNLSKSKVFVKSTHGRLQRGNMKISESSSAKEFRKRTCPFYKKIPGTGFTVDAFQYGEIEGCTAYFLTHFHSDHYAGLSKNFTLPVYCSEITGSLLKNKLRVQEQYIHQLPMDTECVVDGVKVVLLDANHCPGAAMILFHLPNGAVVLHTGDFRADPSMERSLLAGRKIHTLYLDTTYCSPEYSFPSQQEVIQFAINTAFETVTLNPRALVVCGTYCIGKEKVFLAIADVLGSKVGMSQEKYKTLQCLNIPEINSLITTDMSSSMVHLLPMMQINFKGLQSHLKKCDGKYDQILAFRPTGWTHSNNITSIAEVTPQTKGKISIYGIPYSEHSSYLEMKRFVQWLKPQKIIPTVNVGTYKSRSTMEKYFKEWKLEAGY
ncbi:DNA cross-link repair 1A protein [Nannospalax galili]|uniref:DNA cross-link repair 1A protein n=1 Tax=Nannospalax galili TaxID=1026970 RepID=UPI0004ED2094|nr:DNA cross-link repair 1A protein [Nannospalax galili]